MIPLRDTIPTSRVPLVNYALIVANVAVFLYAVSLGRDAEGFIMAHGLVPRAFTFSTLLTSMFLHGGLLHLVGNMLYLYIFGDNIEDRLGSVRYILFYLLCGIAAGAAQAIANPDSTLPMVGASGAVAGVLGAYLLFFPRARVVTLVPIFFFLRIVEIPAVVLLVIWFAWQLLSGIATLGDRAGMGGVAFFAHVGGFLAGMVLGPLLQRRRHVAPRWG